MPKSILAVVLVQHYTSTNRSIGRTRNSHNKFCTTTLEGVGTYLWTLVISNVQRLSKAVTFSEIEFIGIRIAFNGSVVRIVRDTSPAISSKREKPFGTFLYKTGTAPMPFTTVDLINDLVIEVVVWNKRHSFFQTRVTSRYLGS